MKKIYILPILIRVKIKIVYCNCNCKIFVPIKIRFFELIHVIKRFFRRILQYEEAMLQAQCDYK